MAIKPDYEAGTVSITNGTTTLTGVNTFWALAGIQKGDTFKAKNLDAIVQVVVSNTEITLKEAWTGGDLAAASYALRYQPDGSRFAGAYAEIREMLDSGNVSAFAALSGAADKIAYFTGAGAMALADFKAWARSFLSLTPAADKLVYFSDASTAALVDFKAWARSMLGLTPAADKAIYFTDGNTAALMDITAAARALLDDPDASAMLTTLGFSDFFKSLVDDVNGTTLRTSIGLGNVDNTSDVNKPVSTAQATALAGKLSKVGDQMGGPLRMSGTATNNYQLDALDPLTYSHGAGILYSAGSGLLIINEWSNGGIALVMVGGGVVLILQQSNGLFTTSPNNSGTVNVFYESTLGRYQVQNMRGGPISLSICFLRTRNSV